MDDQAQPSAAERPVFVSYATADRKQAIDVCKAIERRGAKCWISTRDVPPGENYQEAIVRSLRASRAMVLVFSESANNSDEIKKELSLASRYHVPVMALRIEDVEPSDAFAYELSTRQWIDAFAGWDKSIDSLVRQIGQISATTAPAPATTAATPPRPAASPQRRALIAAAALAVLLLAIGGWWLLRPRPAAVHSMMVRLAGFQRLSTDLPAAMPDAVRDEIIAAFGDQGVVGVSTAPAPAPGSAPAYALGGTIRRDGDAIRVIARLTNERSGATLWSNTYNFDANQVSRVPRRIAVDAGNIIHCGLYAASTYPKSMPDPVMSNYMQACQNTMPPLNPTKGLDYARRVVAAAPDFSWGWSAITIAAAQDSFVNPSSPNREEIRNEGLRAAAKALALDPTNSEALAQQVPLMDPTDWIGQEKLLKRALAARPLDCGCEHLLYGFMLQNVGRYADGGEQYRRAVDMLALDGTSQYALADTLTALGKPDEAKPHFEAAADLDPDPRFAETVAVIEATETGNYASGIKALSDPKFQMAAQRKAALLAGYRAMASGDAAAKAQAVKGLLALPVDLNSYVVIRTIAVLGANHEAFQLFVKGIGSRYDWPSVLWYPSMRGVLSDPGFPALAERLGLIKYWRSTHTRPDVCSANGPPPFCKMI